MEDGEVLEHLEAVTHACQPACVSPYKHRTLSHRSIPSSLSFPLGSRHLSFLPVPARLPHSRQSSPTKRHSSSSASGAIHALLGFPSEPFKSPLSPPRQQPPPRKPNGSRACRKTPDTSLFSSVILYYPPGVYHPPVRRRFGDTPVRKSTPRRVERTLGGFSTRGFVRTATQHGREKGKGKAATKSNINPQTQRC